MKFNKVIMNPPYGGNLHLYILREINKFSNDIVDLCPMEWLRDGYAPYKKNSEFNEFHDIREKVTGLTPLGNGSKYFDLTYDIELALFRIKYGEDHYDVDSITQDSILDKVVSYCKGGKSIEDNMTKETEGNIVIVNRIYGGSFLNGGIVKDYRFRYEGEKRSKFITGNNGSIKFETESEAKNFSDFARTKFFTYLMSKHRTSIRWNLKYLPFMEDYTRHWNSEQLYDFFGLTSDEIRRIEKSSENFGYESYN